MTELELVTQDSNPTGLASLESAGGFEAARLIAVKLDDFVKNRRLSVRIGNGTHLRVEAWCALASIVGISPRTAWVKKVYGDNPTNGAGEFEGYCARVEIVSNDKVIGAAECGCYLDEKRWSRAERHSIQSMAQTRATSKALGQILRWIPELAGYSGTPFEEMPGDMQPTTADMLKQLRAAEISRKMAAKAFPTMDPESDEFESVKFLPLRWALKTLHNTGSTDDIKADDVPELIDKMLEWEREGV